MAAPLTNLLKGKPKHLEFMPKATKAFDKLKKLFITAPVLKLLDPTEQFIVEVDASEVGLGVVLSQECNYNIGNRELLLVKAGVRGVSSLA